MDINFLRPKTLALTVMACSLGLTGCNSNNGDGVVPGAVTMKTVTVSPSLGRISNARVVLRNAVNHQPIGDAPLNGSGQATFRVSSSVPAIIAEVVPLIGGPTPTYFDEGTGTNQPLPAGTNLRAVFTLANAVSEVGITALTEAAVRRAQALAGGGADPMLTPTQIAQANALVNQAFGVANILQAPVLIGSNNDYNQLLNAANQAGRDYAMRLAALARQAHDALPAANSPAVAMMNAVASDLSDGKLDRAGANFPANDIPYANVAAFAQNWANAVNALVAAVLGNIQSGLTQQQINDLNSLFAALAQNLNFNPDPNAVVAPVTCASLQLPQTNAAALTEFVGNFTVDIFAGAGVKTGTATFSLAANGNVTLDAQVAHPTEICGPNTQGNGTGYLIITDRNETGKTSKAMVNLFKDNSSMLSVEGVNFAGAANTVYSGSKQGAVVNVPVAVSGFAPNSGIVGSTVTINGTGFDADLFHMVVKFSNNIAAEIVSATTTQLVVKVPAGAVTGPVTVTNGITNLSGISAGNFTVQAGGGGNTWTTRTLPGDFVVNSITFGNGKFVVVGAAKGIFTSTDGISWTTQNSGNQNSPELKSVIFDGSQFVAAGGLGFNQGLTSPLIATSPDGITWTSRTWTVPANLPETQLNDLLFSNNMLTAVGANGTIITSTDGGITWVSESQINNNETFLTQFSGLAANGTRRVAVGRNGPGNGMIISNNGAGWTPVASNMTDFMPRDVVWTGAQFVAVGASDGNFGAGAVTMTSPDGVTWTRHAVANAPASHAFRSVFWDGGKLYGGGDNSQSSRMMMSSTDGITWTLEHQSTVSGQGAVAGVAGSSSIIVGVGGAKSITKP